MDTQAFQHRLSLFPQLTLRQRRLAHHELSPLIPSLRLPLIYRIAAIAPIVRVRPRPLNYHPGGGAEGYVAIAASNASAPVQF